MPRSHDRAETLTGREPDARDLLFLMIAIALSATSMIAAFVWG